MFETFGCKTNKNGGVGHLVNEGKMVALYEKGTIFPVPSTPPRKFTGGFFWDLVDRPTNVGSKKAKNLERTEWTTAETMLHNRLCRTDGNCDDYKDFDSIDDADMMLGLI